MATGAMTLVNDAIQKPGGGFMPGGDANIIANINWRIIPATAIAAGIFWGIEQLNAGIAKGLAMLAFGTALIVPIHDSNDPNDNMKLAPMGTLLQATTGSPAAGGYVFFKGSQL